MHCKLDLDGDTANLQKHFLRTLPKIYVEKSLTFHPCAIRNVQLIIGMLVIHQIQCNRQLKGPFHKNMIMLPDMHHTKEVCGFQ
jgi:hypothetical protein